MKLTSKAINAINNRASILALCLALDFTELWVGKLIAANKDNGPLTTATALEVIRKETGWDNSEILEETQPEEVAR